MRYRLGLTTHCVQMVRTRAVAMVAAKPREGDSLDRFTSMGLQGGTYHTTAATC